MIPTWIAQSLTIGSIMLFGMFLGGLNIFEIAPNHRTRPEEPK